MKQYQFKFLFLILSATTPLHAAGTAAQPKPIVEHANQATPIQRPTKWNFLVYIAANNNLFPFVKKNIEELERIGSNKYLNIFFQLDNFGKKEVTRYFVEKGKSRVVERVTSPPISVSGTPENLFDFVRSSLKKHPADRLALVLWSHGSGIKDFNVWRRMFSPRYHSELFEFDSKTNLYEVDKSFYIPRGIGYNDIANTYLNNPDLKKSLHRISTELLGGKKIDILAFDACNMAMVEVGTQVRGDIAHMIGSEEIIPARGFDYFNILKPLQFGALTTKEFANHIVKTYGETYNKHFADLTLSSIDLQHFDLLEQNIDATSLLLLALTGDKKNLAPFKLISGIRNNPAETTSFLDRDYIDLTHFYKSLLRKLKQQATLRTMNAEQKEISTQLKATLEEGLKILEASITSNSSGQKAPNARGLSIYFPTKHYHTSYIGTDFYKKTHWSRFLYQYLLSQQARYAY